MNPNGPGEGPGELAPDKLAVEPDSRFPSGPWTGFYVQPAPISGRFGMDLILTFRDGLMLGEGRDRIGEFLIKGRYTVEDGKCRWVKSYPGQHTIMYQGYNEGKGIWGTWEHSAAWKGGFRIWPVGMPDPTINRLEEEADQPASAPADWIAQPAEVGVS